MAKPWKVEKHTGEQMVLERESEVLEIDIPNDPMLRRIFVEFRVGESVDENMLWVLLGRK